MSSLEYVKRPIKNVFDLTTIGIIPTLIECACGQTWEENDGFSCADFIGKHANHNVKFARFPIAETILAGNINKRRKSKCLVGNANI